MCCLLLVASSAATELNLNEPDNSDTSILIKGYDYSLPTLDANGNITTSVTPQLNPEGIPLPDIYCEKEPQNMATLDTSEITGVGDGYHNEVMAVNDAHAGNWGEWESYAEKLRDDPHTVILAAPSSNETWGTRAAPQVTYVSKDATISATKAGAGLLIIDAGAHITGNIYFEGLVIYLTKNICTGEDDTNFSASNLAVYGAIVVVGEEPLALDIASRSLLKYSSAAIANLNNLPAVRGATMG